MLFMKVEIFGTQKRAMPLSFSNFNFLPTYKADSAGSRTCPFKLSVLTKAYFITRDTHIRLIPDVTAEIFKIQNCSVRNLFKYVSIMCNDS